MWRGEQEKAYPFVLHLFLVGCMRACVRVWMIHHFNYIKQRFWWTAGHFLDRSFNCQMGRQTEQERERKKLLFRNSRLALCFSWDCFWNEHNILLNEYNRTVAVYTLCTHYYCMCLVSIFFFVSFFFLLFFRFHSISFRIFFFLVEQRTSYVG